MITKENLQKKSKEIHDTRFKFEQAHKVPTVATKQLTFGCTGWSFDATVLYIDMRHSTKLLDENRRNVVAKLHMAYYNAIVSIARDMGGEIRSFNGDSLLVFFLGNSVEVTRKAVRCAFKMKYAITQIVNPAMSGYQDINFGIGVDYGNIIATKVGIGGDDTTKDLIWLGDAVNRSTRLSDECKDPYHIGISSTVYGRLDDSLKFYNTQWNGRQNVWNTSYLQYNDKVEYMYKTEYYIEIK